MARHPIKAVSIPNADRAIVAIGKLTDYLLNPMHKRGGAQARLLLGLGYRPDAQRKTRTVLLSLAD